MKSKQNLFIEELIKHPNILRCPHCDSLLNLEENTLKCIHNHHYDISAKGTLTLVQSHRLKPDPVYNKELFQARRAFIKSGFYDEVHQILSAYIQPESIWCDMGAGEGSHAEAMLQDKDALMIGVDLSKPAILMGSDYIYHHYLSIIADLAHLPIQTGVCDGILNFLSPSNEKEMDRILKQDGIFIKVIPGNDYLKELRVSLGMETFKGSQSQVHQFEQIDEYHVYKTYPLDDVTEANLLAMTPLSQHRKKQESITDITIDLKIVIYRKKGQL